MRKVLLCFTFVFVLGFGTAGVSQAAGPTLKKITAFDLPDTAGKRFDYLTIDEDDHYLISAHLAAGQTYVIDVGTRQSRGRGNRYTRRRRRGICSRTEEVLHIERT
jgi:hypothetical protein